MAKKRYLFGDRNTALKFRKGGYIYSGGYGSLLNGVDMGAHNLSGSNFATAELNGVIFVGSILNCTGFFNAKLRGVNAAHCSAIKADFRSADLSGAVFAGADLRGANFTGAILNGVDFMGANLDCCNFTHTDLSSADLYATIFEEIE